MLEKVRLGKTGLMASRVSMGCIPIQRLSKQKAVELLLYAFHRGVNFYDTAHVYTDSEEKLGQAFSGSLRDRVIIASKTMSSDYETAMRQIDESLRRLKTDYLDICQWHNPENLDGFMEKRGPYQALQDARAAGKIRFIGISNHSLERAHRAIDSGAFDTLQFPFSALSSPEEIALSFKCKEHDIGVIGMKAMCGGLLPDGRLPFIFLSRYPHIVPIWGIEKQEELDQFLHLAANQEPYTDEMQREVEKLRQTLGNEFCRACGYCLPCPAGIDLPNLMRITFMIGRMALNSQFTEERQAAVRRIDGCINCRICVSRCPYHLDAPAILKHQQHEYYRLHQEYLGQAR